MEGSSSAAATTPTTITSLNVVTTQEYVQEVPLETGNPLVDGGEVEEVVKLDQNILADVHAIMAKTLPRHVIIQSNVNNQYLHYYPEDPEYNPDLEQPILHNVLLFKGDYSFDLDTRFEVVPATAGTGLVHIRCLRNNKYLVWDYEVYGGNVTAQAEKPEEDQSDKGCTLFQPVFVDSNRNRAVKLRHVTTGSYVGFFFGYLCLIDNKREAVFTFIDWETVVMLPDLIRIKGDNGNHLKAFADGFLDYNNKADNSSLFDYEVSPSRDGGVRLRSAYYDKYWTDMHDSEWVLLKQASTKVHETNTVFLPTILGGNQIIMRCLENGYFCNRYDHDGKWSCLATLANYPDQWSTMEIEEPVISRKINNVTYHLNDARIYGEKVLAYVSHESVNKSHEPNTIAMDLRHTEERSSVWSASVSLTVGITATVSFGIPLVAEGSIETNYEFSGSYQWGKDEGKKVEVGSIYTVTVPAMKRLKASLMATVCKCDIPFSYTQHDVLSNGTTKVYEKDDGLFTGQNGFKYRYETEDFDL